MKHRTRLERAEQLGLAAGQLAQGHPLRQVAAELGVARSTLRGWRAAAPLAGLARGGGGVPGDPGGGAVAAPTGGGDAFDHHPAGRRRGAAGV
ncbi:helix-turn-helix domain-containing protein [uncultured Lamprocystis sp.]|uniref:helix-turn-helix domain-containing protein n=1 Tax=uncultured Lamprocystis sp. TaxID=543132 RepID=UPI0026003821|nr:helix-turn-helix domain-containing protein [uncultured Lamprocystis sp.]